MKYPTLYSRASTGAIRHWTIETEGGKYRTIYGQKDGKTTVSEWYHVLATNVGRVNERSVSAQAEFEAEAQWKRNQELGYFRNIEDIDRKLAHIEVMLANKYFARKKHVDFKTQRWGLQLKLNGNRDIASIRGHMTRGGKMWLSIPHIVRALEPFFEKWPDSVIDGELYNYELREKLNELSNLIRKSKPTPADLIKSENMVEFYIYDGYGFAGMTEITPYHERKAWIDKNIVGKYKYVKEVATIPVSSEEDVIDGLQEYLADGQEGAILRNMLGAYEHKRSDNLLKVKLEDDDEGKIVSIVEGKGNAIGTAKTATVLWKGKEFDVVFMGKQSVRRQILEDSKKWIGKTVTFLYMGLTGLGTPNYGRIDPANCFKADR